MPILEDEKIVELIIIELKEGKRDFKIGVEKV